MRVAVILGLLAGVRATSPVGNESTCYATDDTVYTADSCNSYDKQACDLSCTSDYCQTICGSSGTYSDFSCDSGSGALCAMDVFSNINQTCQLISVAGPMDPVDPGMIPERKLRANQKRGQLRAEKKKGSGTEDDEVTATGCDDHAYCSYCKNDESCSYIMNDLASSMVSNYEFWASMGWGPLGMNLLSEIEEICTYFSEDPTAFTGKPPSPTPVPKAPSPYPTTKWELGKHINHDTAQAPTAMPVASPSAKPVPSPTASTSAEAAGSSSNGDGGDAVDTPSSDDEQSAGSLNTKLWSFSAMAAGLVLVVVGYVLLRRRRAARNGYTLIVSSDTTFEEMPFR